MFLESCGGVTIYRDATLGCIHMDAQHMVPAGNGSAIDIIAGTSAVLNFVNSMSLTCEAVSTDIANGASIVNCTSGRWSQRFA
jgi:hypothetical protein